MKRHHLAMKYSKLTYLSDKKRMPHKTEKPLYFNVLDAKLILSFSSLQNISANNNKFGIGFYATLSQNKWINWVN